MTDSKYSDLVSDGGMDPRNRFDVAHEQKEPVEWLTGCPECGMDGGCDCGSGTWNPHNREWQGLTDEEMKNALVSVDAETKRLPPGFRDFARAIEALLKEKNYGR